MLTIDRDQQLDQLLGTSIAEFDIPDDVYELAVARYKHLGNWFSGYWAKSHSDGEVYPQGSFRLGTVVRPINPRDHYDIDLVCRRDIAKESTSQQALKQDVGLGISLYVVTSPQGTPIRSEGKRCWTLDYPFESFHMDVLPALPDGDGAKNAILLTDRELREWQRSNPIDFASWFYRMMREEWVQLHEGLLKRMDVADVPEWKIKTTLQRTVQALKRHRDRFFADAQQDRPASIILTTLAAMGYRGGGTLYEVLVDVTAKMPSMVERRNGVSWVANPVQPEENFADRWRAYPHREARFFEWVEQASSDFSGYGAERGVDRVLEKVARTLGEDPAKHAGKVLGSGLSSARDAGVLGMGTGTGLLGPLVRRPVPRHTFHGDAPPTRRS